MGMTLGSLFDGAGGFPLAGTMAGITPVWASEIELFPIRVTTRRFPGMKHIGNITEVDGGEIEPVDIITFGSPCQDLSVAGSMNGLQGKRSGLFLEAIRIIREMRKKHMEKSRNLSSGKTCREHSSATAARTSGLSSKKSQKSKAQGFMFLDLTAADGKRQGRSWETDTPSPGGCTMPSIGEYPREERESTLSQILEDTAPEKYNLSATACAGILRRARERGKELPKKLEDTLRNQAAQESQ